MNGREVTLWTEVQAIGARALPFVLLVLVLSVLYALPERSLFGSDESSSSLVSPSDG